MIFYFEHTARDHDRPAVTIDAAVWFDARSLAMRIFDCEPYALASKELKPNGHKIDVDVSLRWVGNDADGGGSPQCRRLEFKRGVTGKWLPIEAWR